jgi:hypothetical protein
MIASVPSTDPARLPDVAPGPDSPADVAGATGTSAREDVGACVPELEHDVQRPPSRLNVLILAAAVALVRFLFTIEVRIFSLSPDEAAYAGMSRFLAGRDWNMLRTNTWRPGYSALLAPISAVTTDPVAWIRAAFALNAVIAGLSVVVLVKIVHRLTNLGPRASLLVSGVIALSPASLSASGHVWAEPLVTLAFLGVVWSLFRYFDERRIVHAAAAIVWATAGYTSHGRMLPVMGLAAVMLVGDLVVRRSWPSAMLVGAAACGGVLLSNLYANWVFDSVWTSTATTNTSGGVLKRLARPLQVVDAAFGQLWYQLCSSAMVFGVGIVGLVLVSRRDVGVAHQRRDARIILALVIPMILMSVTFMSDRARADHVIYGRYTDAIAWPVLAAGAGWLIQGRLRSSRKLRRWVYVGVPIVLIDLALMVRQLHYRQLRSGSGVIDMIPNFMPLVGGDGQVPVLTLTAVSCALFGGLVLSLRRWPHRPNLVAGGVVVTAAAAAVAAYVNFPARENNWEVANEATPWVRDNLPEGTVIGISLMPDQYEPSASMFQQISFGLLYQWYLPDYEFVIDEGLQDDVGPYVVAPGNDLIMNLGCGEMLWEQRYAGLVIWHDPDPNVECVPPPLPAVPIAQTSSR